jgi:hypothetical protein
MSDSHKEFYDQAEIVARMIIKCWQQSPQIEHFIFIAIDPTGFPSVMSSVRDSVQMHAALRQIGETGDQMLRDQEEIDCKTQ